MGKVLAFVVVVAAVQAFLLKTYSLSTELMAPGLDRGDLVLSVPLLGGLSTLFGKLPPPVPLVRGDLVVVLPEQRGSQSLPSRAWDSVVRFFTLQRLSPLARREAAAEAGVYRIIGLPGDKVRRRGAAYEVLPKGQGRYVAEQLLARRAYSLKGEASTTASDDAMGEAQTVELAEGRYFVASDDRSELSGSQLWGSIGTDRMGGRLILRFWPLMRIKFL